jgi:hypothetical protein
MEALKHSMEIGEDFTNILRKFDKGIHLLG